MKQLLNELRAYKRARVLACAVELGILDELAEGPASTQQLAEARRVDPEWAAPLLSILAFLGLVSHKNEQWQLTESGREALDEPAFRAFAAYHAHCYESWLHLPERCRDRERAGFHSLAIHRPAFADAYVRAMEAIAQTHVGFLSGMCRMEGRIVDVGAGPSTFCRQLASAHGLHVVGVDLPPIVAAATRAFEYPPSFTWQASDFRQFHPDKPFESMFCSHLLEYCPESGLRFWLQALHGFLRSGAYCAAVVFLKPDAEPSNVDLDLFELSTGLNGGHLGHIWTCDGIRAELRDAGAMHVEVRPLPEGASYSEYLVTWNSPRKEGI